jgi:hypothetical protein
LDHRNGAAFGQAGQLIRADYSAVFDTVPRVRPGVASLRLAKCVDREVDGAIADGVQRELPTRAVRGDDPLA